MNSWCNAQVPNNVPCFFIFWNELKSLWPTVSRQTTYPSPLELSRLTGVGNWNACRKSGEDADYGTSHFSHQPFSTEMWQCCCAMLWCWGPEAALPVSSPWPRHEPWKSFTPYRRPHCFLAVVLLPQERKWLMGRTQLYTTCVLLFFLLAGMLNSGPHASTLVLCQLSHSVRLFFFNVEYFWDRVLWTVCPDWLQTPILLISACWLARITGAEHRCCACPKGSHRWGQYALVSLLTQTLISFGNTHRQI
jgi:hypothetical protein